MPETCRVDRPFSTEELSELNGDELIDLRLSLYDVEAQHGASCTDSDCEAGRYLEDLAVDLDDRLAAHNLVWIKAMAWAEAAQGGGHA